MRPSHREIMNYEPGWRLESLLHGRRERGLGGPVKRRCRMGRAPRAQQDGGSTHRQRQSPEEDGGMSDRVLGSFRFHTMSPFEVVSVDIRRRKADLPPVRLCREWLDLADMMPSLGSPSGYAIPPPK